jgi:hypothetical protein
MIGAGGNALTVAARLHGDIILVSVIDRYHCERGASAVASNAFGNAFPDIDIFTGSQQHYRCRIGTQPDKG